ncbi:MAG: glycosyltransferase family 2 protein [Chthonomonadales bacterium]|nr:glycosyltransferase family 2 protein [Chthonomonadales bacterium]
MQDPNPTTSTNVPLFSVIIPTCDRNEMLALCLERLDPTVQQYDPNRYEVIVTDNGTKRPAEGLIQERFPWVTWVRGPGGGAAANRNRGAIEARGEWLVFTDDDCQPDTGLLRAYDAAVRTIQADAMEGAVHPIGDPDLDMAECPINLHGGLFWSANVAVRAAMFHRLGGFNPRYPPAGHEDEDLYLRLREHTPVPFIADARINHPIRIFNVGSAVSRIPLRAQSTGLYYSLNARRLGIRRFTTLVRWIYKPRLMALLKDLVRGRPRSAFIELLWVLYGNVLVLRCWFRETRQLSREAVA